MIEYGHGVKTGTETVGGGDAGGGGGGPIDAGENLAAMAADIAGDTATAISGLPPVVVALGAALLVVGGLLVLRRVL